MGGKSQFCVCHITRLLFVCKGLDSTEIRLSACSFCSLAKKEDRSCSVNLFLCPANPTWHGWASVPKVSHALLIEQLIGFVLLNVYWNWITSAFNK